VTRVPWKVRCRAGDHRYRGREHAGGCVMEPDSHMHVRCRRCPFSWLEPMLFDPRPYGIAA